MKVGVSISFASLSKTGKKKPKPEGQPKSKRAGRVTRTRYTEQLKPKERLAYLEKFPRSSFRLITDDSGKIVEKRTRKKKEKPEGKPRKKPSGSPRKESKAPARKRAAFSKALTKRVTDGMRPAHKKRVMAAIQKINNGDATKRNLNTLKKLINEDHHGAIDKAFKLSKKRSKADVETRRKEISKPKPSNKTPKKSAKKSAPKEEAGTKTKKTPKPTVKKVERPDSTQAARAVQELPKKDRGKFVEALKRIFSRKAKPDDIKKVIAAQKQVKSKNSKQALQQVQRYAEQGVGKKGKKKTLTKLEKLDRIRDVEMPKSQRDREMIEKLNADFKKQAKKIQTGKGTKDERTKAVKKLQAATQAKVDRLHSRMTARNVRIREMIAEIREEDDREVGKRMKSQSAGRITQDAVKSMNGSQLRKMRKLGLIDPNYRTKLDKRDFTIGQVIRRLESWQKEYDDLERDWENAIDTPAKARALKIKIETFEEAIDNLIEAYDLDVGYFNDGYHFDPNARIKVRTRLPHEKKNLNKHDAGWVRRQQRKIKNLELRVDEYVDGERKLSGAQAQARVKHLVRELNREIVDIRNSIK